MLIFHHRIEGGLRQTVVEGPAGDPIPGTVWIGIKEPTPEEAASIYGMNFHHMPELDWTLGYPLALLLEMLSAALPFLYFRRKGWL
jgi:Mg2+ and Co2+ transporter CorA